MKQTPREKKKRERESKKGFVYIRISRGTYEFTYIFFYYETIETEII